MHPLIEKVELLKKDPISKVIDIRMAEFAAFKNKGNEEWFSELCFCILTANSKQKTGAKIQQILGPEGFLRMPETDIAQTIQSNKHRFHNNKARYIALARKFSNIKDIITTQSEIDARAWLVENIYGLGLKEASHFLRNTGHQNISILDRHILNLMSEYKLIERPKTLTPKNYLAIENVFTTLAHQAKMTPAKLDLYLWYMKTGEVLK